LYRASSEFHVLLASRPGSSKPRFWARPTLRLQLQASFRRTTLKLGMSRVWQTIRSYIWWTHERGSFHYDVMVTLILLFIFLTPRWINFKDKPTERIPHQTGVVVVVPHGDDFIYQIDAAAVEGDTDAEIREDLVRVIEPIAGEIVLSHYEAVRDSTGHIKSYRAWVSRPY